MGGPAKLQLQGFRGAVYDPTTNLTYSALTCCIETFPAV